MVLSTHAVAGAAAGLFASAHPLAAFAAGVASHFLLDAVPHWHYPIRSLKRRLNVPLGDAMEFRENGFRLDVAATAFDCLLGFAVAVAGALYFSLDMGYAVTGAAAGVLPDLLQLAYHIFPSGPLRHLQRFHKWIHAESRLDDRPVLGIGSQLLIILFFVLLMRFAP